jgi:hypothetical protein
MRDDRHIAVSRIQAWQAVIVAAITAVSSVAGTLLATNVLDDQSEGIPVSLIDAQRHDSAPLIFVASEDPRRSAIDTERCKRNALSEMNVRGGKVIATGESWIAMEWRDFGIMIMCREAMQTAAVIVAGGDSKANGDLAVSLRETVLERR